MDAASVLGHVAWLFTHAPNYRYMFVSDLERVILPAIVAKQFKLYRKERIPVGFVSWAYLSEEAEQRFIEDPTRLRPEDWKSGDRLWCIDLVSPFGGFGSIAQDLKENVFPDKQGKALRRNPDGSIRVAQFWGVNVEPPKGAVEETLD